MPGRNLGELERRFRALDARQHRLELATQGLDMGSASLAKHRTNADPDPETGAGDSPTIAFSASDYVEPQLRTLRAAETVDAEEAVLRAAIHNDIATHTAAVKRQAQQFLLEQEVLRGLPTAPDDYELRPPRQANAGTILTSLGHGDTAFVELFLDERTHEAREQLLAVSRLVGSSPSSATKGGSRPASAAAVAATAAPPATQSLLRAAVGSARRHRGSAPPDSEAARGTVRSAASASAPVASPYANPRPLRVHRGATSAKPPDAAGAAGAPQLNGPRLARSFFEHLPSVVPCKQLGASVNKPRAPRSAAAAGAHGRPAATRPTRPGTAGPASLPPKEIADIVYSKAFYHLHVKILHQGSSLSDWVFNVVISDVTHPDRVLRHTFKNLRVNANMYIIFSPPSGIVLSPCDDIPWVASPQSLFRHTFRVEAVATHPTRTKVVDTLVHFSDTAPPAL